MFRALKAAALCMSVVVAAGRCSVGLGREAVCGHAKTCETKANRRHKLYVTKFLLKIQQKIMSSFGLAGEPKMTPLTFFCTRSVLETNTAPSLQQIKFHNTVKTQKAASKHIHPTYRTKKFKNIQKKPR